MDENKLQAYSYHVISTLYRIDRNIIGAKLIKDTFLVARYEKPQVLQILAPGNL
jgi:hypothetical protein